MYFDMAYADYMIFCFLKWSKILETQSIPNVHPQIFGGDGSILLTSPTKSLEILFSLSVTIKRRGPWDVDITVKRDGHVTQKKARHVVGSWASEIRSLMLLAMAMGDTEALKVLGFFMDVCQDPAVEYAYAFSERCPTSRVWYEHPLHMKHFVSGDNTSPA